jgi:hypothetical protein
MLWKEVGWTRDAIVAGFGDIVQMASVVVLRQAEEPDVKAVGRPQGTSFGIFIDDGLGAGGSHWVAVPVVYPFEGFLSWAVRMNLWATEKIDWVLDLGGKFVP